MREAHEQYEHAGLTVKIYQDIDAESPDAWDNNVVLVAFHDDVWVQRDGFGKEAVIEALLKGVGPLVEKYHVFGVEAYIHSGVVLALSKEGNFCDRKWDVSEVGALFISKEEWPDRKKAIEYARAHIETWNQHLSGDVWGFVIEDAEGEHLDSCWGHYGLDFAKESANSSAECEAKRIREASQKALKAKIKHRVPLSKR